MNGKKIESELRAIEKEIESGKYVDIVNVSTFEVRLRKEGDCRAFAGKCRSADRALAKRALRRVGRDRRARRN